VQRKPLVSLLRLTLRDPLECRIDLILAGTANGFALGAGRLGWSSWQAGEDAIMRSPTGTI
jgi:predicted component of type VI protein secretion system